MLIKKLPVDPSPPKLSFHWAVPWVNKERMEEQLIRIASELNKRYRICQSKKMTVAEATKVMKKYYHEEESEPDYYTNSLGNEHNEAKALAIFYKDEKIKVWASECNPNAHMSLYFEEGLLELVPFESTKHEVKIFSGVKKEIYDAALLDGCNKYQAELVATGKDPYNAELVPVGWYRMTRECAEIYCDEHEMSE